MRVTSLGTLLLSLLLLSLLLAACGECESCKGKPTAPPAGTTKTADPADGAPAERTPPTVTVAFRGTGTTLELSVWEMHCAGCEKTVEDTLKALPGVADVTADHKESKVTVTLKDAAQRDAMIPQVRTALAATSFKILGE